MHGSVISSTSDPIEGYASESILLDVKDEDYEFFSSQPLAGKMKTFKPLIDAMKTSIGNRPMALAEEVEAVLLKKYPNAISEQRQSSFADYVFSARQSGLPIRCDQSWGKPKYMWFTIVEERDVKAITQDKVKDKTSTEKVKVKEETYKSNETRNVPEIVSNTNWDITGIVENWNTSEWEEKTDYRFDQNSGRKFLNYTSIASNRCAEVLHSVEWEDEQGFELQASLPSKSKRKRKNRKSRKIKNEVEKIISKMDRAKFTFCSDQNLFTFAEAIVKYIVMNPTSDSIIGARFMENFIKYYYPTLLGSPTDSNSKKEKVYIRLLRQSNEPKWNMPIFYLRDGFRIDIGKLQQMVTLFKEDE